MNPNISQWQNFVIKDVFNVSIAKSEDLGNLNSGNIQFVGRSDYNNGVLGHVDSETVTQKNCITIGMVGTYFPAWQEEDFVASQNILVLRNEFLNQYNAMFVCSILKKMLEQKYCYGRPIQKNKFVLEKILLPEKNGKPDFQAMEDYVKTFHHKQISTHNKKESQKIDFNNWQTFRVSDVFKPFINGKGLTQQEIDDNPGDLIAVQSSSEKNAVMGYISREFCEEQKYKIINQPCLTVARSGSAGFVSFQNDGCVIGDSAKALILKNDSANKFHYLFLRTILMANFYKFAYGRKVKVDQYMKMKIMLPAKNGEPDWDYMEQFIKSLPYSDRI
ncbi:MAG: restriction endonuclease subunit S [Bacilli bacterium]|nr:restriction endonuclease subunit S [Bacilli bacterium]